MTLTTLILIVLALILMIAGLYIVFKPLSKHSENSKKNQLDDEFITHDKNGVPIVPRTERQLTAAMTAMQTNSADAQLNSTQQRDVSHKPQEYSSNYYQQQSNVDKHTNSAPQNSLQTDITENKLDNNEPDIFSTLVSATENIMPVVKTFDENQLEVQETNSPVLQHHIYQEQSNPILNFRETLEVRIYPNDTNQVITGEKLLTLVDMYGLRYGTSNMFHRYANSDGTGTLWFSMMMLNTDNAFQEFDLNRLHNDVMNGLVLFICLPHPAVIQGFDSMMSIANLMADALQANVYDKDNQLITREVRQNMREYAITSNQ